MLSQRKLNRQGLVTAFQKLAQLDGGKSSMFSSHPSSPDRAKHIQQRIAQNA
jgi:putative metalloprotease